MKEVSIVERRYSLSQHHRLLVDQTARHVMAQLAEKEPASSKVFAIPELLEKILMDLGIRELLVNAQRVDKTWHATIKGSKKLQQALFLEPIPLETIHGTRRWSVKESEGTLYLSTNALESGIDVLKKNMLKASIVVNPLTWYMPHNVDCYEPLPTRQIAKCAPNASWRRMLLTQPPVKFIYRGKSIVRLSDTDKAGWSIIKKLLPQMPSFPRARYANQVETILRSDAAKSPPWREQMFQA